jgi:RimJ/RimL family protein N-acetyltransferase
MVWRPHESVDSVRGFLELALKNWEAGTNVAWIITHKDDGRILGSIALRLTPPRSELGYVIAQPDWGNGYATEAVTALIEWVLAQPAVARVGAVCSLENPASARVLEKSGMRLEGVLRRWLVLPNLSGDPVDVQSWARVKGD